ncbi:hypothetical protein BDY24DRAFT_392823 [Mrakia frigida]|uniref:uncharacterized protein n=1 Tax=Mrakia frigida TaxID=29902 RepID=UPI003FCC1BFD
MGDLKFSDLARLMAMASAMWSVWAGFWGICYRKFFWDFIGAELGPAGLIPTAAVQPFLAIIINIPLVQILMLLFGVFTLCLEWPLVFIKDTSLWRSHIFRVVAYFMFAAVEILLYQGFDGAVFYLITSACFARALQKGESIADDALAVRRDAPPAAGGEGRNWQQLGDGGGTDSEKAQRNAV